MGKPIFRVSNRVRHISGCTATEHGLRLEILDLGSGGIVLYSKNKDTDQMHCYCTLPLFWHVRKLDFLMIRLMRSLAVCYFICILGTFSCLCLRTFTTQLSGV